MKELQAPASAFIHAPFLAFLGYAAYQRYRPNGTRTSVASAPVKLFRLFAALGLVAALAACSNADPLPVATGPLYQLNAANWHATPQDLEAPPQVANN